MPVRILFNGGSQLSYVTNRLQHQLHLKPTRIEKLHLNTFDHSGYKTQECAVVSLYLQDYRGVEIIRISALTSLSICSPLPSIVEVGSYLHLQDLPLADECAAPRQQRDVLVSSWTLVTGDVVKSSD